jgi:hypothetical protein
MRRHMVFGPKWPPLQTARPARRDGVGSNAVKRPEGYTVSSRCSGTELQYPHCNTDTSHRFSGEQPRTGPNTPRSFVRHKHIAVAGHSLHVRPKSMCRQEKTGRVLAPDCQSLYGADSGEQPELRPTNALRRTSTITVLISPHYHHVSLGFSPDGSGVLDATVGDEHGEHEDGRIHHP